VDLASVAREVVEAHAGVDGRIMSSGVESVVVRGDRVQLRRAVENLVENALVHGPVRGVVAISVVSVEGRALLTVRDEGPGPDVADRERLFERFYRGGGASGRPGSGLGLSIVAAIVARHGGDVRVDGSAFTLELPALDDSHSALTER
jgi:two-component system, OmpR family, sensor kinase